MASVGMSGYAIPPSLGTENILDVLAFLDHAQNPFAVTTAVVRAAIYRHCHRSVRIPMRTIVHGNMATWDRLGPGHSVGPVLG